MTTAHVIVLSVVLVALYIARLDYTAHYRHFNAEQCLATLEIRKSAIATLKQDVIRLQMQPYTRRTKGQLQQLRVAIGAGERDVERLERQYARCGGHTHSQLDTTP